MTISRAISSAISCSISSSVVYSAAVATLKFLALVANAAGEMVGVKTGTGDLTEACTSVRYAPDHEGVHRPFAANEPAWKYGRVVENMYSSPEDMTVAAWAKVNCTVASEVISTPLGGAASKLTEDSGSSSKAVYQAVSSELGNTRVPITVYAKEAERSVYQMNSLATSSEYVNFDLSNGTVSQTGAGMSAGEYGIESLGDGWYRCFAYIKLSGGGAAYLSIQDSPTAAWNASYAGDGSSGLYLVGAQAEDTRGRSDLVMLSEYVGEGLKVFNYANGNTVLANVVTEAKGADFDPQPELYAGPGLANSALHGNDLTNAVWLKTNMTAAFDAEGVDGAPSNGSTLTATAPNATVFQTITAASGKHASRFVLRRKTGTGTVGTTVDGGTTWTAAVLTTEYQEFIVDKTALTNPQIGIRIVTSGDEVEVGNGECHLTSSIAEVRSTSPVFTSGAAATVNATNLSFDDANHPTEGGYFAEWTPEYATSEVSGDIEIISLDNNAGLLYYDATNSQLESTDGTNTATVALTIVAGTTYKIWVAYGGTSLQVGVDASTGTATSFDGAFASGTKIELCTPANNVSYPNNLQAHETDFDNAVTILQELAA